MNSNRRYRFIILAILLIAVSLRLTASLILLDPPRGDAADYDNIARNLLARHQFVSTRMGGLVSYRPPLYPMLLAGTYAVWGISPVPILIIQALLGAVICLQIYRITARIYGPRSGLFSAALVALYPPLIYYSTQLLAETLFIFLLLAAVELIDNDTGSPRRWLGAGAVFGLAALCRPVIFPYLILLGPLLALRGWRYLRRWVWLFPAALVIISGWTLRNYLIHRDFVLLTTYGGANLWLGNCPGAGGRMGRPEDIDAFLRRRDISEPAKDRYCYRQALEYISSNPRVFLRTSLQRLLLFWNPVVEEQHGPEYIRSRSIDYRLIIGLCFSFLVLLVLLGVFSAPSNRAKLWIPVSLIIYFPLIGMVYYVSMRYRQPVIPFLAVFAGRGAELIREKCFSPRSPV